MCQQNGTMVQVRLWHCPHTTRTCHSLKSEDCVARVKQRVSVACRARSSDVVQCVHSPAQQQCSTP
jgi:hypothetical protein